MHAIYSRTRPALEAREVYQNPRHFAGVLASATSVTVHGDFPAIVEAYRAAKVPVGVVDGAGATSVAETPEAIAAVIEGEAQAHPKGRRTRK